MRIAFIVPSLANRSPIRVVRDLISEIKNKVEIVDLYYFDDIVELKFDCPVYKIKISDSINFNRYDIIHSHLYRPDKFIWKNRKKIKVKTVTTLHSDIRKGFNIFVSLIIRWVWLVYLKNQTKIVILTKYLADSYYTHYINHEKIVCINNGRTLGKINDIAPTDINLFHELKDNEYKIIGANALLNKVKGLRYIVEALPLLNGYVFVIVGDGPQKNSLLNLANKLGVRDRCHFLGFKPNAIDYLKYYDVYAMPSLSEGFSLALVEAALMKCSCVCSNIGQFMEMFNHDEVTFFKLKNKISLMNAVEYAYTNRKILGENAFKRASENYTTKIMGDQYLKLYKSLLV
jgi:glycosyltransferase involved in cell wall biosynthesis